MIDRMLHLTSRALVAASALALVLMIWMTFLGTVSGIVDGVHIRIAEGISSLPEGAAGVAAQVANPLIILSCLLMVWFGPILMAETRANDVSGSALASASAMGSAPGPERGKRSYDAGYAANVSTTASITGLLILPSHNMIIFTTAAGAGISIGDLFLGGTIPGVVTEMALMFVAAVVAVRQSSRPVLLISALPSFGCGANAGYFTTPRTSRYHIKFSPDGSLCFPIQSQFLSLCIVIN